MGSKKDGSIAGAARLPHQPLAGATYAQPHPRAVTVRHLEPQVMDLLVFLAATSGRVVSKDEIIDAVWDGRFIAETTLTRSIADLRRALDDNQRCLRDIETIAKRGYRLVATTADAGRHCRGGSAERRGRRDAGPRVDRGPSRHSPSRQMPSVAKDLTNRASPTGWPPRGEGVSSVVKRRSRFSARHCWPMNLHSWRCT